jgi:hypothetical protein
VENLGALFDDGPGDVRVVKEDRGTEYEHDIVVGELLGNRLLGGGEAALEEGMVLREARPGS